MDRNSSSPQHITNDEIKKRITEAFAPLEVVFELDQYETRMRVRLLSEGVQIIGPLYVTVTEANCATKVSALIDSTRQRLKAKGVALATMNDSNIGDERAGHTRRVVSPLSWKATHGNARKPEGKD